MKVQRHEVLDYQTYSEGRDSFREKILAQKEVRRVHLGPHLTFLFENKMTVLYQIQEMMRIEKIVKESDILHEMTTYNGLLGGAGELGCTLLIEIDSPQKRDELLRKWLGLEKHIYVLNRFNEKVYAAYDPAQVGEDRISSVQYLKFSLDSGVGPSLGCDFGDYNFHQDFTEDQRNALQKDFNSFME